MNIYNKAHELAGEVKLHPDVIEFRKAAEKIKGNELAAKMFRDFRELQMEAYTEQMKTGKMSKSTEEKLQKMASVISLKPDVNSYLQAEAKFSVMWQDIMKILNDAIGVDFNL